MSADNLVYALPFRKMTGEVVWRVAEVTLSGLPYELCHIMSTDSRVKRFQEFGGADAARQAHAAAVQLERRLSVCEYGTSLVDATHEPFTMAMLQQDAVEQGYSADTVFALREACDDDFAHMEVVYWSQQ